MLNRVILMGRLTADPEHKQTPSGISVTSFSIAVDRNYNGKDGNRFDPQGTATRAEVAAMLRRFLELMIDQSTAQG